jgi:hypothetical protein
VAVQFSQFLASGKSNISPVSIQTYPRPPLMPPSELLALNIMPGHVLHFQYLQLFPGFASCLRDGRIVAGNNEG